MLKITRSSDPIKVDRLNLCLYGPPGVGKSSLAFTAERPLLLDFDQGAHRAANRKDTVRVTQWGDVASMTADDLEPYATIVVDTAGRALDQLTADIIKRNPKAGRGGALTLQGYGTLKAEFVAWLKMLNAFGKDVILIAHMDEQRNGDEIVERLDVQGGSKGEIYKAADAMGRLVIREGKRVLNFSPTDAAFGKNPGQLEPLEIPHSDRNPEFLSTVVQSIKDKLNALTAEQAEAQQVLVQWRERIAGMGSAEDFNAALADVKKAPKAVQAMFSDAAKLNKLDYSKADGKYVEPVAA
jgi:hypothetical protein